MSTTQNRPENLDYGSVNQTTVSSSQDSPPILYKQSPNFTASYSPSSPPYSPSSPPYSLSSPQYVQSSPTAQQEHKNTDASGGSNKEQIFVTDVCHIPGWATGFVLGGKRNKRLWDIIRRNGNIVEMVGEVTRYQSRNKGVFQVVTLCAEGHKPQVVDALRSVKRELVMTIVKARKMKRDGDWRDNRRHNEDDRRSRGRYEDDRRSRGRYEDDRRNQGRYEDERRNQGRYEDDRRSRGRYEDGRRTQGRYENH